MQQLTFCRDQMALQRQMTMGVLNYSPTVRQAVTAIPFRGQHLFGEGLRSTLDQQIDTAGRALQEDKLLREHVAKPKGVSSYMPKPKPPQVRQPQQAKGSDPPARGGKRPHRGGRGGGGKAKASKFDHPNKGGHTGQP